MRKDPKIVFMGTPEFAVASLDAIAGAGYCIEAVISAPDRPSGRGRRITSSPVAQYAANKGLKLLQPVSLKDPGFLAEVEAIRPDLAVVVAFRMLPAALWQIPLMGTFNLHASLLPQYRGAAPINHAIINGETETGVTTFMIDEKIDTGNILLQERVAITDDESAGELHDRLMSIGAELVVRTVEGVAAGKLHPRSQSEFTDPSTALKEAPKIFPSDCIVDFGNDPGSIHNLIRGLSPYPGARVFVDTGGTVSSIKILRSDYTIEQHGLTAGSIETDGESFIRIASPGGFVYIRQLQAEGKRAMECTEFLRGNSAADWRIVKAPPA